MRWSAVARLASAAFLAAALLPEAVGAQSHCSVPNRRSVMLKSPDIDPDVLVWDAKERAVDYASGHWRDAHDVMNHTVLAKPGTRAETVQCEPSVVRFKYEASAFDAVGVRLLSGPNHGRYGWVTSRDVHLLTAQR